MTDRLSQIELTDDYKVGIESVDQEHVFLIGLYNDLARKLELGTTDMLLETAVGKLFDYADYHFASEERLMWVSGFPELEHHKHQHDSFVRTLNELAASRSDGDVAALRAIALFVSRWVRGHILVTDKVFGEFILTKRDEARASS